MALVYAVKTGDWSDTTVWNTGSLPTNADVVRPNNFTVTIDVDVDVLEMRNNAGGGAVLGGRFVINDGVTVTSANGFFGTYASLAIGLLNYNGAGSVILNGDVEGSKSVVSNTCAISNTSTGTITINGNISSSGGGATTQTLRNLSTGTFIINGDLTSAAGILVSNAAGTTTIVGNITSNGATSIANTSGTVTITGDCNSNEGIILTNISGVVSITGDISQNSVGANRRAIEQTGNGVITIIGNLSGCAAQTNTNSRNVVNTADGTINITGTISSGTGVGSNSLNYVVHNTADGVINITGTINGTSLSSSTSNGVNGVRNSGLGTINITGNVNGDTNSLLLNSAVYNTSTGVINISGNAIGGSTGLAVANDSTGTINLNGNAIGGTGHAAIEGNNAAGLIIIEKAVYSNLGQTPTRGYIQFKTTDPQVEILATDLSKITLYDVNQVSGLMPSISDVRSGTTYSNGTLTGSLAVPNPNTVLQGVATDNTVGTLLMTPADFWNYLISNGFASGSIGERLKDSSTVDTTGAQVAGFLV